MTNHPSEFCIICLVRVGYGIKRIAKILKIGKSSVFRAKQRYGFGDVVAKRLKRKTPYVPITANDIYSEYWMDEELSVKESDYPDWYNHIERLRLVVRKTAAKQYLLMKSENRPTLIASRLRTRIVKKIKESLSNKCASTNELTGCSWIDLQIKLQNKFDIGMTWDNYGS